MEVGFLLPLYRSSGWNSGQAINLQNYFTSPLMKLCNEERETDLCVMLYVKE